MLTKYCLISLAYIFEMISLDYRCCLITLDYIFWLISLDYIYWMREILFWYNMIISLTWYFFDYLKWYVLSIFIECAKFYFKQFLLTIIILSSSSMSCENVFVLWMWKSNATMSLWRTCKTKHQIKIIFSKDIAKTYFILNRFFETWILRIDLLWLSFRRISYVVWFFWWWRENCKNQYRESLNQRFFQKEYYAETYCLSSHRAI
jgi:hypothetical protein